MSNPSKNSKGKIKKQGIVDLMTQFYQEMDQLEKGFVQKMEKLERVFTKLKEKIERQKENPEALLKRLKKA